MELIDSVFSDNTQTNNGGAISFSGRGTFSALRCTFRNNTGYNGGAVYAQYATISFTDCIFDNNRARNHGNALMAYSTTQLSLTNCNFTNNIAGGSGSAILANAMPTSNVPYAITRCRFENNVATQNSTICSLGGAKSIIQSSSFLSNRARHGGALYTSGSSFEAYDSIFNLNTASEFGGAFYIYNSAANHIISNCHVASNSITDSRYGGILRVFSSTMVVTTTTFTGNADTAVHISVTRNNIIFQSSIVSSNTPSAGKLVTGVYIVASDSSPYSFTNTTFSGNYGTGFSIEGGAATIASSRIVSNTLSSTLELVSRPPMPNLRLL